MGIIKSIFSNWAYLVLSILTAFIVSPIIINTLGSETYGVWTLLISITGYFTLLDFGINTAILKFVARYTAQKKENRTKNVFRTSFVIFLGVGLVAVFFLMLGGLFFKEAFNIDFFTSKYLSFVVAFVALDLGVNLLGGVFLATLKGLERYFELNLINIVFLLIKNSFVLYLLHLDYSILALAILIFILSLMKNILFYKLLSRSATFSVKLEYDKKTAKLLLNYSLYSVIIAIAMKIIFYTDAIVVASFIDLSSVTFYAIATMIVENLENLIWAAIGVFIPLVSRLDATGSKGIRNSELYILGTRYTLLFLSPIFLVLILYGETFINLWMGQAFGEKSGYILNILLIGFFFSLSQLIASAILKGISRHKALAYIFSIEAFLNLVLSIYLVNEYGLVGVALGTTIPLILSNFFAIPFFTTKVLELSLRTYYFKAYFHMGIAFLVGLFLVAELNWIVNSFFELFGLSVLIALVFWTYGLFFVLDLKHRNAMISRLNQIL
jgi:O-antigen/teichoic acid export membrane protein